jgi:GNAT superfamily N-acetyltransferase
LLHNSDRGSAGPTAALKHDLVSAATANLAAWHDSSLAALGIATVATARLWSCPSPAPFIYLAGITLDCSDPEAQIEEIAALQEARPGPLSVMDSWGCLDLQGLGFEVREAHEWMVRPPRDESPKAAALELEISPVLSAADLAEFEVAAFEGFGIHEAPSLGPGRVHAPEILADESMRVFAGRVGDRVVAVSMAYVAAGVVGVYGVATLPAYRRKGYGESITRAALAADPRLPAVLQPSPEGLSTYRRMGFSAAGPYRNWFSDGSRGRVLRH